MAILITGVAGFVGVNLAKTLLESGNRVYGMDNLSRGTNINMKPLLDSSQFEFVHLDITDADALLNTCQRLEKIESISEVWHLAANSDIPAGIEDSGVDLKDTFMTTYHLLNVLKKLGVRKLAFASSSAIYGDHGSEPLTEDLGPFLPISNYGAMKLASEAAISAAVESFLHQAWIFRFPNVIGIPATHGVILDFINKLKDTPEKLTVLGDGSQQKGYLHVNELIEAMLWIQQRAQEKIAIYNIGADDTGVTVKFIAQETVRTVKPNAQIEYGQGNKGWIGDVPRFIYSIEKLKKLGWQPKLSSKQAIQKAIEQIVEQEHSGGH